MGRKYDSTKEGCLAKIKKVCTVLFLLWGGILALVGISATALATHKNVGAGIAFLIVAVILFLSVFLMNRKKPAKAQNGSPAVTQPATPTTESAITQNQNSTSNASIETKKLEEEVARLTVENARLKVIQQNKNTQPEPRQPQVPVPPGLKRDLELVNESLMIAHETKSLDTFIGRLNFAHGKAVYIMQIIPPEHTPGNFALDTDIVNAFGMELPEKVILECSEAYKLKTTSGQLNRLLKIKETLEKYQSYEVFASYIKIEIDRLASFIAQLNTPEVAGAESEVSLSDFQIEISSGNRDTRNLTLDELTIYHRNVSERAHLQLEEEFAEFDPHTIDTSSPDYPSLCSTEKFFLKHIGTQPVEKPNIQAYWTYDYNLDYAKWMTKLLKGGYLSVVSMRGDFSALTVAQLKDALRVQGLPLDGKKSDLVDRVSKNISKDKVADIIYSNISSGFYELTKAGIEAVKELKSSATKNLELEDNCIQLLLNKEFSSAYKLVCEFERSKPNSRGVGVNWEKEYQKGLSDFKISLYDSLYTDDMLRHIPEQHEQYNELAIACLVFCEMMGMGPHKFKILFTRITDLESVGRELTSSMFDLSAIIGAKRQKHNYEYLSK